MVDIMTSVYYSSSFHAFRSESPIHVTPKKQTILGVIQQINSLPWTYRHQPIMKRIPTIRTKSPTEFLLE